MGQEHAQHNHTHAPKNERKIAVAAVLTGGFMFAEAIGGAVSGSLALIADAGHMLTDFAALVLAWIAFRLARRPADWKRTYGFDRFSVMAAFLNGLTLFLMAAWICYEAYQRLNEPREILGGMMLWIALGGLAINVISFLILTRGESENLNVRSAALHVAGDLLGSVAALIASLVILWSGWTPIDPLLSIFVALIILKSAWTVVKESGHILLEGAPHGFDRRKVAQVIAAEIEGVQSVDHIHAWSVTQERPMVTMEVQLVEGTERTAAKAAIKALLLQRFKVEHTTVEIV